jgi:predicted nucleic acid-binding protein
MDPDLPYLPAGDMLFVAMAKKDAEPLITEDRRQLERAREAEVTAFTLAEYLSSAP